MTEPVIPDDNNVQNSATHEPAAVVAVAPRTTDEFDLEKARAACHAFESLGYRAGWVLAAIGLLVGVVSVVERAVQVTSPTSWVAVLLRAGLWTGGCALAGCSVAALTRMGGSVCIAYLFGAKHDVEMLSFQAAQTIALLERITRVVEERHALGSLDPVDVEKAKARAEIERATRSAAWEEAEALLSRFEVDHADDTMLTGLRGALQAARQSAAQERLAELEAARAVNDPDRVIEVYETVAPLLGPEARAELHGGLAPWFLSLIHRRLRHGKIQPEVVRLAERFSEAFSTTVEGASVRASLSTLRRSVGLCPRCSRPYIGLAEACPRCLGGPVAPHDSAPNAELASPG
jgi:hypothetical protein